MKDFKGDVLSLFPRAKYVVGVIKVFLDRKTMTDRYGRSLKEKLTEFVKIHYGHYIIIFLFFILFRYINEFAILAKLPFLIIDFDPI